MKIIAQTRSLNFLFVTSTIGETYVCFTCVKLGEYPVDGCSWGGFVNGWFCIGCASVYAICCPFAGYCGYPNSGWFWEY